MVYRITILTLAFGALLGGCFHRRCGPNEVLRDKICFCAEGTTQTEDLDCVKKKPTAPPPVATGDAGATGGDAATAPAMSGTCDEKTGLGCNCKSDEDCAGRAADYCIVPDPADSSGTRVCLYQGCDMPDKACPDKLKCCSFFLAPQGTVCLPTEIECPFG